jgi:hypothetical protein
MGSHDELSGPVHGPVHGPVVMAGTIVGGVHLHLPGDAGRSAGTNR